jgi:hypothetical protein
MFSPVKITKLSDTSDTVEGEKQEIKMNFIYSLLSAHSFTFSHFRINYTGL